MGSARITIERILRDDDDCSGQTIRQWKIESEGRHITIRDREDHLPFLMLRPDDIEILIDDLRKAKRLALEEASQPSNGGSDRE